MTPNTLIIRTAGTNCDRELVHAFEAAGATTETHHLNDLLANPALIERADIIGFPGGFSYGDDIAAGRIFANRLRHRLYEPLHAAITRGVPIIGICNGFQVLVKLGLLPDPAEPGDIRQTATLADNTSGRFTDRWVRLVVPDNTVCVWTQGLVGLDLPIAHGEGRFVPESKETLDRWESSGQIAIRYAHDDNPNGSVNDIAGVCDRTGLVFGLMPHPERYVHPTQHPAWARIAMQNPDETRIAAGLQIIRNAVDHVRAAATATK